MKDLIRKVIVLLASGDYVALVDWQKMYGLEVGSDQVGKHFALSTDVRLQNDIYDYGEVIVCEPLIRVMDLVRQKTGHSMKINAFNRSSEKQRTLRASGYRAALWSTHVEKMAADLDTKTNAESLKLAVTVKEAAKELGVSIRVGVKKYLATPMTFIHVDVGPMYFAKGAPFYHRAHPEAWERQTTW